MLLAVTDLCWFTPYGPTVLRLVFFLEGVLFVCGVRECDCTPAPGLRTASLTLLGFSSRRRVWVSVNLVLLTIIGPSHAREVARCEVECESL